MWPDITGIYERLRVLLIWCTAGVGDVDAEDPPMFLFMIMLLGLISAVVIIIIVFFIMVAVIIAGMTAAGIISASVFIGYRQRSLKTGLYWFFLLSFLTCGLGAGLLLAFVIDFFGKADQTALLLAVSSVAGVLGGWLAFQLCRRLILPAAGKFFKPFSNPGVPGND